MEAVPNKEEHGCCTHKEEVLSQSSLELAKAGAGSSTSPAQRTSFALQSFSNILPGDKSLRLPSLVQGILPSPQRGDGGGQSLNNVKLPSHHEASLRVDQCYLPLEHIAYIKKIFEAYDFVKSGLSAKMDVEVRRQLLAVDPPHMKRDLLHRRHRGSRATTSAVEPSTERGSDEDEFSEDPPSPENVMHAQALLSDESKGPLLIPDPPVHDEMSMKKRRRLLLFGLIRTRPGIDSERREDGEGECLLPVNTESDSESDEDEMEDATHLVPGGLRAARRLYRNAHNIAIEHIRKNQAIVEEEIERLERWKVHQKMLRAEAKANCEANPLANIAGPTAPLPITVIPSSAGIPFTFFAQQIVARYFSSFFPINNGSKEFEPRRKQHIRAAKEVFRLMDTNADGFVSWDEFSSHILQAGQRFILKTELRRAAEKVTAASSNLCSTNLTNRGSSPVNKDGTNPVPSRSGSFCGAGPQGTARSAGGSTTEEGKENEEAGEDVLPEMRVEYELGFTPEPTNCSVWQATYPLVHHLYHQKPFSKIVVSYRSRRYVTAGPDGLVKLWKPDTRLLDSQRRMAIVHERNLLCTRCAITDLSLTPPSMGNAEAVVVSAMDGTITLLRTATGEVVRTLLGFRSTPSNKSCVALLNDLVARGADREKKEFEADDLYSLRHRQPVVAGSVIRMPYTIPAYHDDMMEIFFGKTNRYFQGLDVVAPTYTHLKRPVVSSSDILYEFGAEKLLKKLVADKVLQENTMTLCWYATALAVSRCIPVASSNCVLKDAAYLVLGFEAGVAQVYELSMNWFSITQLSATRVEPPSGRNPVTSFLLHKGPISHILISDVSDLMLSTSNDGTVQVRIFSRLTTPHIVLGVASPKVSLLGSRKIRRPERIVERRSPFSFPIRKGGKKDRERSPKTSPRMPPPDDDLMSQGMNEEEEKEEFSPFSSFLGEKKGSSTPSDSHCSAHSSVSSIEKNGDANTSNFEENEMNKSLCQGSGAIVGHTKRITCICYHETQHLIVSGGMDHCVIFWTSRSNRFIRHLDLRNLQYHASSSSVGSSENGVAGDYGACGYPIDVSFMERNRDPLRLVVLDSKRVIRLLNALNGNLLEVIIDNSPSSLALGELLVARYEQNDDRLLLGGRCLRVWDIPRDEEYAQDYFGHKKPVIFMGMDPMLRIFVTADEENIVMWNFTIVPHEIALQRREDRRLRREQERLRAHQDAEKRRALRLARRAREESLAAKEAEKHEREKARASFAAKRRSVIYGLPIVVSRESSSSSSSSTRNDSLDEHTDTTAIDGKGSEIDDDYSAIFNATCAPHEIGTTSAGRSMKRRRKRNPFPLDAQENGNSEEDEIAAIDASAYEDEIPVIHHLDANQFNLTYWRTSSRVVRTWKVKEGIRSVTLETSTRAGGIYVALLRERSIVQYNSFNGAPLRKFLFPETVNDVYCISAGETVLTQADAHGVTPLLCAAYEEDGCSGMASIYHLNHSGEDPDSAVKRELQERAELLARGVKLPRGKREAGAIRSHRNLLLKAEPCTSVAILSSLGVVVMGGRHRLSYSPIMDSTSYPLPCMTLQDKPTAEQEKERRKSYQFFNEHFPIPLYSDRRSVTATSGAVASTSPIFSSASFSCAANTCSLTRASGKDKPSLHLMALFPGRLVEDPVAVARGLTKISVSAPKSRPHRNLFPPPVSSAFRSSYSALLSPSLSLSCLLDTVNADTVNQIGKADEAINQNNRTLPGKSHQKMTWRGAPEDTSRRNKVEEAARGGGGMSLHNTCASTRSTGDVSELEGSARLDFSVSLTGSVPVGSPVGPDPVGTAPHGDRKNVMYPSSSGEGSVPAIEEGKGGTGAFYLDAQQQALGFIGHIIPVRNLGYVFTGRNDGVLQLWNIRSSSEVLRCRVTLQVEAITSLSVSCFGACRTDAPYSPYDAWPGGKKGAGIGTQSEDGGEKGENQNDPILLDSDSSHSEAPPCPSFANGMESSGRAGRRGKGNGSYITTHSTGGGAGHHRRQNFLRDSYFVAVGDQSGYVLLMDFNKIPWEEDIPLDVIPGIERRVLVLDRWRAHRLDVRGICFVGNPDVRGSEVVGMDFMSGSTQVFTNEGNGGVAPPGDNEWLPPEKQKEDSVKAAGRQSKVLPTSSGRSSSENIRAAGKRPLSLSERQSHGGSSKHIVPDGRGEREGSRRGLSSANTSSVFSAFSTTAIPITLVTTGEDTYTYVWVWEKGTVNCLGCFGGGMGNPVVPPLIQMPRRSMGVFEVARRLYVMHRLVYGFKLFDSHKYGKEIEKAVREMERDARRLSEEDDAWELAFCGSLSFLSDDQFPCYKQTFWSPLRSKGTNGKQSKPDIPGFSESVASNASIASTHEGDEAVQGRVEQEGKEIFSEVFDRAGLKGMKDRLYRSPSNKLFSSNSPSALDSTTTSVLLASSPSSPFSFTISTAPEGPGGGGGGATAMIMSDIGVRDQPFLSLKTASRSPDEEASEPFARFVFAFMRGTYDDHGVGECLYRVVKDLRPKIKKFFRQLNERKRRPIGPPVAPIASSISSAVTGSSQPCTDTLFPPSVDMGATSLFHGEGFTDSIVGTNRILDSNAHLHDGVKTAEKEGVVVSTDPQQRSSKGIQLEHNFSTGSTGLESLSQQLPSIPAESVFHSRLHVETVSTPKERPRSSVAQLNALSLSAPSIASNTNRTSPITPFVPSECMDSLRSPNFCSSDFSPPLSTRTQHSPKDGRRRRGPNTPPAHARREREEREISPHHSVGSLHSSFKDHPEGMTFPSITKRTSPVPSVPNSPSSPSSIPRRQLSATRVGRNSASRIGQGSVRNTMSSSGAMSQASHTIEGGCGGESVGEGEREGKKGRRREIEVDGDDDEGDEDNVIGGKDGAGELNWGLEEGKEMKEQILLRGTRGLPMYKVAYQKPGLSREYYLRINEEDHTRHGEEEGAEEVKEGFEGAIIRQVSKLPAIITEEFRRQAIHGNSVKALSSRRISRRDGYSRSAKEIPTANFSTGSERHGVGEGGRGVGSGRGVENLEEAALNGESSVAIVERAYISRRRQKAIEQILRDQLVSDFPEEEEKDKKAQEIQLSIDAGLIVIETYKDFSSTKTTTVLFDKEKMLVKPKTEFHTKIPEAFIKNVIPESFHIQQMGETRDALHSPSSGNSTTTSSFHTPRESMMNTVSEDKESEGDVEKGEKSEVRRVCPDGESAEATPGGGANNRQKRSKESEEQGGNDGTNGQNGVEKKGMQGSPEKNQVKRVSRRSSKKTRSGDWYLERDRMKQRRKFQNSLWSPARIVHTLMAWKSPIPLHLREPAGGGEYDAKCKVSSTSYPSSSSCRHGGVSFPYSPSVVRQNLSSGSFQKSSDLTSGDQSGRAGSGVPLSSFSPCVSRSSSNGGDSSTSRDEDRHVSREGPRAALSEEYDSTHKEAEIEGRCFSTIPLQPSFRAPSIHLLLPHFLPDYLEPCFSKADVGAVGHSESEGGTSTASLMVPSTSQLPPFGGWGGLSSTGRRTTGSLNTGEGEGETGRLPTSSVPTLTNGKEERVSFVPLSEQTEAWAEHIPLSGAAVEAGITYRGTSGGGVLSSQQARNMMRGRPSPLPSPRAVWDTALDYNEGKTNLNAVVASEVIFLKNIAKQSIEDRERFLRCVQVNSPISNTRNESEKQSNDGWNHKGNEEGTEEEEEGEEGKLRMSNTVLSSLPRESTIRSFQSAEEIKCGSPKKRDQEGGVGNGPRIPPNQNEGHPRLHAGDESQKNWVERSRPRVMTLADVQRRMMKPSPALS